MTIYYFYLYRFITDSISTVAFGFNCNSLRNPNNEFRHYGKLGTDMGKYSAVLSIFASNILDFFRLPVFKNSVNKFFIKTFENVVNYRVKEKVVRNDFINMLMDLTDCEQNIDKDSKIYNLYNNISIKLISRLYIMIFYRW